MATLWKELAERVKLIGANWTAYTVVGSFSLYVLGYLALRFHLTVLGVGTDLTVVDERYLFAGARFVVYLVSAVPIVALLVLLGTAVGYMPYRLLPGRAREAIRRGLARVAGAWSRPLPLSLTGVVLSVLLIQLVMRQCFLLSNLLLAPTPPPGWVATLLLAPEEELVTLYFSGLLLGCAVCAAPLAVLLRQPDPGGVASLLRWALCFFITVQVLLLPVNYGCLIADKSLPRVRAPESLSLRASEDAWLAWEGKEGLTYLVRRQGGPAGRTLITLPRAEVKRIEIVGYDRILPLLFAPTPTP